MERDAENPHQEMLVLFDIPSTRDHPTGDPGMHHMQLRNATREVLCERYRRLRRDGIVPHRSTDHGPSTSFYYRDPDQNVVELASSNFQTGEQMLASYKSEAFLRNPSGKPVDPEEVANRILGLAD